MYKHISSFFKEVFFDFLFSPHTLVGHFIRYTLLGPTCAFRKGLIRDRSHTAAADLSIIRSTTKGAQIKLRSVDSEGHLSKLMSSSRN